MVHFRRFLRRYRAYLPIQRLSKLYTDLNWDL